jgi:hypothetical protein
MADLGFLAAGVQEDEHWTRTAQRSKTPNPFQPKLESSWSNRAYVGTGQNRRMLGSPYSIGVQSWDSFKQVKNALTRAARDLELGLSLGYFGPPEDRDDGKGGTIQLRPLLKNDAIQSEEDWDKVSGGDVVIKFRAKPKRRVVEDEPNSQPATVAEEDDTDASEDDEV